MLQEASIQVSSLIRNLFQALNVLYSIPVTAADEVSVVRTQALCPLMTWMAVVPDTFKTVKIRRCLARRVLDTPITVKVMNASKERFRYVAFLVRKNITRSRISTYNNKHSGPEINIGFITDPGKWLINPVKYKKQFIKNLSIRLRTCARGAAKEHIIDKNPV